MEAVFSSMSSIRVRLSDNAGAAHCHGAGMNRAPYAANRAR
jgi:hypothetical protein